MISTPRGVAVRERHDIVYREMPADGQNATPAKPPAAPAAARHSERHLADPVLLFRYSALTFNGHRIHYDRDYVTKVEGYPGLIVHGPLQAALLVEMAAKLHGGKAPATFVLSRAAAAVRRQRVQRQRDDVSIRPRPVDRQFGGAAHNEGHRDVVRSYSVIPGATRSNPESRMDGCNCRVASSLRSSQ